MVQRNLQAWWNRTSRDVGFLSGIMLAPMVLLAFSSLSLSNLALRGEELGQWTSSTKESKGTSSKSSTWSPHRLQSDSNASPRIANSPNTRLRTHGIAQPSTSSDEASRKSKVLSGNYVADLSQGESVYVTGRLVRLDDECGSACEEPAQCEEPTQCAEPSVVCPGNEIDCGTGFIPVWPGYNVDPVRGSSYETVWFRSEFLMWWLEGSSTPPLVTSGTLASLGVLDNPDTRILFGDTKINDDLRVGGRFHGGLWLTQNRDWAIEGNYLFLGQKTAKYHAASDGDPLLARPYYDIVAGVQSAHIMAFQGFVAGSVDVSATSRLQGAELLLRRSIITQRANGFNGLPAYSIGVDFLGGYRFLDLAEDLRISESLEAAGPTTFQIYDMFDTTNQFHGAELGFSTWLRQNRFFAEFLMKLALGNSHSRVIIDGETTTTVGPGPPLTSDGGLLALTTNMGQYTTNDFAVIPELGITLGYDITDQLRATFGYTLIYWSRVARPGEQIDLAVNPSYIPNNGPPAGANYPRFSFATTDLWIQGMNLGLELRF